MDVQAFKARIGNERFPYVSGQEARDLIAEIERLQREADAGKRLYEAAKAWGSDDLQPWSMDIEIYIHEQLFAAIQNYEQVVINGDK